MAKFVIPSDPALNIQNVNEILETDPVLASFINGYFQQLLENDQALKNLIKKRPPKEELARVASTGSYNDLADKPKIPSGDAADANIANNDTTTEAGYVADARIVKKHGDEIDSLADHAFLAKYGLLNKETVIADGTQVQGSSTAAKCLNVILKKEGLNLDAGALLENGSTATWFTRTPARWTRKNFHT